MSLLVRAYPLQSPVGDLKEFASALSTERKAEASEFYRRYGVSHESWHLQETPSGAWVIAVSLVDDLVESPARYASSSAEFESWFKAEVLKVTGVRPDEQPLGPPTTPVYVWSDDARPNSQLCT